MQVLHVRKELEVASHITHTARNRDNEPMQAYTQLTISSFIQSRIQAQGMVLSTTLGLPISINHVDSPCRHAPGQPDLGDPSVEALFKGQPRLRQVDNYN